MTTHHETSTAPDLTQIHETLSQYKHRLTHLETATLRPNFATTEGQPHTEHKAAFINYLRKGKEQALEAIEKKSLSVGADQDGGYLVTRHMQHEIHQQLGAQSVMRSLASVETITSDALDILDDYQSASAGWTTETAARDETDTPRVFKRHIPVFEMYAQPKATQKLIDDAAIDIEQWLQHKISTTFAGMENAAFLSGDGSSKPRGILTYDAGNDWGKVEHITIDKAQLDADTMIRFIHSLHENYTNNATLLMHRSTVQALRTLKEKGSGRYLWNAGLSDSMSDTFLGFPVVTSNDMPSFEVGNVAIAFADFKQAYRIVDRAGIRVLRDPFTDKPFVKFYTTKRVGGDVTDFRAIKLLKLAA
jgi:HK97 family phage major capsid protein